MKTLEIIGGPRDGEVVSASDCAGSVSFAVMENIPLTPYREGSIPSITGKTVSFPIQQKYAQSSRVETMASLFYIDFLEVLIGELLKRDVQGAFSVPDFADWETRIEIRDDVDDQGTPIYTVWFTTQAVWNVAYWVE